TIPFHAAFLAHSDGDVLLHALCDALLGAAALGDIGRHFPDNDAKYHKIDSRVLLRHVRTLLGERGYYVVNADMTIVAQAPKLAPFISRMQENIAEDLQVEVGQVNVKATTTEGLGFAGRQEGIAAYAVALISK
ncbi:MAG TPA: 2-C-methyl-D-erythritol 2,4-cyclodiphosphate synthase, partial [Pseudomonadales bacterium]|nr:2-C-methyl-D-erythritol 2,4-cyclodiphosphate synthase [Pseudomonadales bacterium]